MGQAQNTQDPQRPLKITPLQQRYPHIHLPKKYGPSNQHMHAIDLKNKESTNLTRNYILIHV